MACGEVAEVRSNDNSQASTQATPGTVQLKPEARQGQQEDISCKDLGLLVGGNVEATQTRQPQPTGLTCRATTQVDQGANAKKPLPGQGLGHLKHQHCHQGQGCEPQGLSFRSYEMGTPTAQVVRTHRAHGESWTVPMCGECRSSAPRPSAPSASAGSQAALIISSGPRPSTPPSVDAPFSEAHVSFHTALQRTHSSEDISGDVVPSQVQPPQGSVVGETVHEGPAPQEANVIPAQVWKETCSHQMECTWWRGSWPGWSPSPSLPRAQAVSEGRGSPRHPGGLTQLLEGGIALQGQGQLLGALVTDLVVAEVQLLQRAIGC
ncbi:hypothetical protein P7K49_012141 [Saguinus oedipus]|uniref:Uncharacterized protein n=1 Tax=Saguinus oedipus TaxID=9490 RepID=A0ABQ9VSM4_SAGOE|nr:hypothetical protein P7K49_012141 [Saguinus oedipus]